MEETLFEIFVPVGDTAEHFAGVDEIEAVFSVGPLHGHIVHLENAIRGHPVRLGWRKVGAGDLGVGEGVCHLDGPDTGAGADVEDPFGLVDGGEVEFVVESEAPGVMGYVLLVVVGFIVGTPVGTVAVGVIAATVLPAEAGVG